MRKIQIVLVAGLCSSAMAFAPSVMAQYNMMPVQQQPTTAGQPTQTTTPPVTMGPRVRLSSPPNLPGLSGYQNIGSFISGSSFPSCSTGPVYLVFLVADEQASVAQTAFQNLMNSGGWTPSTPTGSNALSGTMGNTTCQVQLDDAFGNNKVRIYIDYRINNNPPPTSTSSGSALPTQSGCGYGGNQYATPPTQYGCAPTQYSCGYGSTPGLVPGQNMQSPCGLTPGMVPSGAGAGNQGMSR
jgi:hypothetical protein